MLVGAILLLSGCAGQQSSMDPAGPQAGHITALMWPFIVVSVTVWTVVTVMMLVSIARRNLPSEAASVAERPPEPDPAAQRRRGRVVGAAVVLTAVILILLTLSDFVTGRAIHRFTPPPAVSVRITGHQWWWEVQYMDWSDRYGQRVVSNRVMTANELHLPVGQPVKIQLVATDVIHSFWVPNLHGKKDMIPNHPIGIWIQADKAGDYWGQCAEFCGYQHANMRLAVTAEDPEKFYQWLENQRKPAPEPQTESQKRGKHVLESSTCITCHSVQGTMARGQTAPNLTHIASRPTIGAGAAPNERGHRAGWILDPQAIKPGTHMPQNALDPQALNDLLDYLDSLK